MKKLLKIVCWFKGHIPRVQKVKVYGEERWARVCRRCTTVYDLL